MKSLLLISLLFCVAVTIYSSAIPADIAEQVLKVTDLLEQLKNEQDVLSEVQVGDKKLVLKYYGKQSSKPILLIGDSERQQINTESEHELYHDAENHATLTVTKFLDKDGKKKAHLRGSILENDNEIVIEPHHNSIAKRDTDVDADIVRVYRRQIKGRLPTIVDEAHLHTVQKRQTSLVSAFVETLVVCDFSCYNQHAAYAKSAVKEQVAHYIEGYLAHVMNLADLHYQRSFEKDTQLKITLHTSSYVILTSAAASKFTTDPSTFMNVNAKAKDELNRQYVNGDISLNMFNQWLMEQTQGGLLPAFDIAVAFVNSNLFTPSADLLGIAPMSGTCTLGRNGVLVEDSGNFASGSTTAHEVAHNLAVEHDISFNRAACTDELNYVMSTSNKFDNRVNSFYFSSCSIESLKNSFLTKKMFACTANGAVKRTDYTKFISFKAGQLINANEQCQRAMGPNAKLMVGNKAGGGTFEGEMCKVLWCTYDFNSASAAGYAVEGTSCGDGKWCVRGECVADASAPKGQCLVEDDTAFCNDFLSKYGMLNVCNNFKTGRCCKMCGGSSIPRLSGHDWPTFLNGNGLDNVKFLDQVYVSPCVDKYTWCPTNVANWIKSIPNICGGSYTVNEEPINVVCKKSCNLC